MSGGHWNYMDMSLRNEMFDYADDVRTTNPLEDAEISQIVFELFDLMHNFDWYKSGDTEEETYLEAKKKFKDKWLRNKHYTRDVLKLIIEQEFEDKRDEVLKML